MGQKTTTPKTATSTATAAPAATPAKPKFVLRDFAADVAKLSPQMRASSTPTRARVDHENHSRLVVGFAGGSKSLQVSCLFWNPKQSGVVKKGSYLIRTFANTTPKDVTAEVAKALRAKKVIT